MADEAPKPDPLVWYCVYCNAERPMKTDVKCPTPGCGCRSSKSFPDPIEMSK